MVGDTSSGKSSFVNAVFKPDPKCQTNEKQQTIGENYVCLKPELSLEFDVVDYEGCNDEAGRSYETPENAMLFATASVVILVTSGDPTNSLTKIAYFNATGCMVMVVRNKVDAMDMVKFLTSKKPLSDLMRAEEAEPDKVTEGWMQSAGRCELSEAVDDSVGNWENSIVRGLSNARGRDWFPEGEEWYYSLVHSCSIGEFTGTLKEMIQIKDSVEVDDKKDWCFPHTYALHNTKGDDNYLDPKPVKNVENLSILMEVGIKRCLEKYMLLS